MSGRRHDGLAAAGHHALLTPSRDHPRTGVDTWLHAARRRAEKVLTLAAPAAFEGGAPPFGDVSGALGLHDVRPPARPDRLVLHALDEGYRGLSMVVWADEIISATSGEVHADVEDVLTRLCRTHPVSVLCLYDRTAAGAEHLDLGVAHHPDGLHEHHLDIHHVDGHLRLDGEIDMSNLDVLAVAVSTLARGGDRSTLRIDVSGLTFLSVGAAHVLRRETASFRDGGGRVELHDATPHVTRMLRLLALDRSPGLDLVPGPS